MQITCNEKVKFSPQKFCDNDKRNTTRHSYDSHAIRERNTEEPCDCVSPLFGCTRTRMSVSHRSVMDLTHSQSRKKIWASIEIFTSKKKQKIYIISQIYIIILYPILRENDLSKTLISLKLRL